jgi:hypothetical protein
MADLLAELPVLPGAACRGYPRPLWDDFLHDGHHEPGPMRAKRHQAARVICGGCPVLPACDLAADELASKGLPISGIWAGKMRGSRSCKHEPCGRRFQPTKEAQVYCDEECRRKADIARSHRRRLQRRGDAG